MRAASIWSLFWSIAGAVTVRGKIMGIVLGLVLLLGLGVTFQVRSSLFTTLSEHLDQRGLEIGQDVASRSADLILTNNLYALAELAQSTLKNNEDVRYVLVLDQNGNALVHTFGAALPRGLRDANVAGASGQGHLEVLETEEGPIHDAAVPIMGGRVGSVRVGLLERHLRHDLDRITRQLLVATAVASLVGVLAAYFLTRILTRPILELVEVAKAVGQGDLSRKASLWAKDEIGELSEAFNSMTGNLDKSRRKLEEFSQQILRRNEELSALNTIAAAMSRSLDLEAILNGALDEVLEIMGLSYGEIFVLDRERGSLIPRAHRGIPDEFALQAEEFRLGQGVPGIVAQSGKPLLIEDLASDSRVRRRRGAMEGLSWMISVPLLAKNQVVGVMNFFSAARQPLTDQDSQLLASIGHQVGLAIENAQLWQELTRKEEIRTQLLEKVISAQEEERKRIARELHDETSQALTSLMVGLRLLESNDNLDEIKARLEGLRAIAAGTLEEVHDLALQLRPSVLDDLGLTAALGRYVGEYTNKYGIEVDFQLVGFDGHRLTPQIETALYRIVQEALTNIAKHSEARSVSVLLERGDAMVKAIVEDDGRGFDVKSLMGSRREERRLGLFGMQERASLVGGKLTIESQPGAGTTVFVEVPVEGGAKGE